MISVIDAIFGMSSLGLKRMLWSIRGGPKPFLCSQAVVFYLVNGCFLGR